MSIRAPRKNPFRKDFPGRVPRPKWIDVSGTGRLIITTQPAIGPPSSPDDFLRNLPPVPTRVIYNAYQVLCLEDFDYILHQCAEDLLRSEWPKSAWYIKDRANGRINEKFEMTKCEFMALLLAS